MCQPTDPDAQELRVPQVVYLTIENDLKWQKSLLEAGTPNFNLIPGSAQNHAALELGQE